MRFSSRAKVAGRPSAAADSDCPKTDLPFEENSPQRNCETGRVDGFESSCSRCRKAGTSLSSAAETRAVVGWGHWPSSRKPLAFCRLSSARVTGERASVRERLTELEPYW